MDPKTGKGRGYGFVWFTTEKACNLALKIKAFPYKTMLYKDFCIRAAEQVVGTKIKDKTVLVTGYPTYFKE